MKSLIGTQTLNNLMKAFAGESQARNRYTMFSEKATEEGFDQISNLFIETAGNEKVHAELFFNHLKTGLEGQVFPYSVNINTEYPVAIDNTLNNLKFAAMGEKEEGHNIYPYFSGIAKDEGFPEVAVTFSLIAAIEKKHEERFEKLANNVETDSVFKKADKQEWKCTTCGHIHTGNNAPEICPVCKKPRAVFEIKETNY